MNKILINVMQHFSPAVPALQAESPGARRLRHSFTSGRVKVVVGIVWCSLPAWVKQWSWGSWEVHAMSTGCPLKMQEAEVEGHGAGAFCLLFPAQAGTLLG